MSMRQFTPPHYLPAFTHQPGSKIFLAGSSYVIQPFPTALRIFACQFDDVRCIKEVLFPQFGPISGWTVFIDSMHHLVTVEGRGGSGFIRYRIETREEGIYFHPTSGPMRVVMNGVESDVEKAERMLLVEARCSLPHFPTPRLLLGSNKALNLDRIRVSSSIEEVLPLWYQLYEGAPASSLEPSSTLFGAIVEAVQKKDCANLPSLFEVFFRTAFDGFFVPKRKDDYFLGYPSPLLPDDLSLADVNSRVCGLIRSLFLREEGGIINILPALPKAFVAGRLLRETLASSHLISIEWRKGEVRRILLHAHHDDTVILNAKASSASLLSLHGKVHKRMVTIGEGIEVEENKEYLLDNFSS